MSKLEQQKLLMEILNHCQKSIQIVMQAEVSETQIRNLTMKPGAPA